MLDELLNECEQLHGHICPGQLLGVRMALLGCRLVGISDPRGADRKKILVWVEIDRCLTDAISIVTGTRLGRRSLKFVDYGKVASTFMNIESGRAVRIVGLEEARALADVRFEHIASRRERQMQAYRGADEAELFGIELVSVRLTEMDLPGRPRSRVICNRCLEIVCDGREIGRVEPLCRACAEGSYYTKVRPITSHAQTKY